MGTSLTYNHINGAENGRRRNMNKPPDGKTSTLPPMVTTMWMENKLTCPKDETHPLTGSTRRIYCDECDVYWNRDGHEYDYKD